MEAFALTAGQKLRGGLPDSTVEVNARSAWQKVAEALPVELRGKLAKADSHVSGTLGAELVRLVPRDVQTVVEEAVEPTEEDAAPVDKASKRKRRKQAQDAEA